MRGICCVDIKSCVKYFYSNQEIGNKEIKEMFGCGDNKAINLKKVVRDVMRERKTVCFDSTKVNTEVAFEVWGLDVKEMERKIKKLHQLKDALE